MEALRQVAGAETVTNLSDRLRRFCADCGDILAAGQGSSDLGRIKSLVEELVQDRQFLAEYCGAEAKLGLHLLYEDPKLKFQVLSHVNDKGRVSPPHNHGNSWAIYAQAVGHTDMTEWSCTPLPGEASKYDVKPAKKYRLMPGHAGLYADGAVHSIDYPPDSRFVRVTGTNLDTIERMFFNPATGESRVVSPQ